MKKNILLVLFGMLIMAIIGVGVYAINADQIEYGDGTVADAIDELYTRTSSGSMGVENIALTTSHNYQLPMFKTYTWVADESGDATVDNTGLVNVTTEGDVYLEKNNTRYFKYHFEYRGPALTFVSGKYYSNSTYAINNSNGITSNVGTLLTDGIKTKQGTYDALWLSSSHDYNYIKFTISIPVTISFSSGYYSDSGGVSGQTAKFYKLDENNNETLYTSFVQQNNTQDYEPTSFEPGTYILRPNGGYVIFSEWDILG